MKVSVSTTHSRFFFSAFSLCWRLTCGWIFLVFFGPLVERLQNFLLPASQSLSLYYERLSLYERAREKKAGGAGCNNAATGTPKYTLQQRCNRFSNAALRAGTGAQFNPQGAHIQVDTRAGRHACSKAHRLRVFASTKPCGFVLQMCP